MVLCHRVHRHKAGDEGCYGTTTTRVPTLT